MSFPAFARPIGAAGEPECRYSVCTLVTDPSEYGEMVESFIRAGFQPGCCEFLYCDNSASNRFDAYSAYNEFLASSRGKYIVLCHQDILLAFDGIDALERSIRKLDALDPAWALLGNAGGVAPWQTAIRITHADGREQNSGSFPVRVESLDENFILAKRSANLCLSHDLHGFHFYGTDICQIAGSLGLSAWVVDFRLLHKSSGKYGASFAEAYQAICRKYRSAHRGGYIQTTCALIPVGPSWWRQQRAMFLLLRTLKKRGGDTPESREEQARLLGLLGRWNFAFQLVIYKIAVPYFNLCRSIRKRRSKTQRRET